jgi:hypothetical protein
MIRRMAFLGGLILGSGVCAWILGSALTYLFTGKMPSVQVGGERWIHLELVEVNTLHELPAVGPGKEGA